MKRLQRVDLEDVARAAGVSRSTASRALRGEARVSAETTQRVLETAEALGYVRDIRAAELASTAATTVGLLAAGFGLGYLAGMLTKQPVTARRTMAVEVGMQNSGLATSLASTYMNPLAALPGAVFSVWHNLSGVVLAAICRYSDSRK